MICRCSTASGRSLVTFHQHATSLHVVDWSPNCPDAVIAVQVAYRTVSIPPAQSSAEVSRAPLIVVAVRSAEHHPVGVPVRVLCHPHSIGGISAVPVHRQLIVASIITY